MAGGVADTDSDTDGVPDCNDACPGFDDALDCNTNGTPDGCDLSGMTSNDVNADGIPDECQTGSWIGPDGGAFTSGANWSPAGVPGAFASIQNASPVENRCVLSGTEISLYTLSVGASGTGRQILRIDADASLIASSSTTISPGGEINLRGGSLSGGPISNASNTISGYGTISADIDNDGLVQARPGSLNNLYLTGSALDNHVGGTLRATVGSFIVVDSTSVTQAGEIEAQPLAAVTYVVPVTNLAGATITLHGGAFAADGLTNEDGALIEGFGAIQSDLTNEGEIVVAADLQIVGNVENNGTIVIQNGILTVTGSVSGSGTIIGLNP